MTTEPALTLVTIVRNHRTGLAVTAQSVVEFAPSNSEWVVVDGASNDGTVDEIRSHEANIARWISESDRGIADAFNKGIALARGRYVLFLNAGDCLAPGSREAIASAIAQHDGAPSIVGQIKMAGRVHGKAVPFWRQYMRNHLPHQAMLIRRDLFDTLGGYDLNRRLGMDFEWSLRLRPVWSKIKFVPKVFSVMEPGGISISNSGKTFEAYHAARVEHFGLPGLSKAVLQYYRLKTKALKPFRPLISSIRRRKAIKLSQG